MEIAQDSVVTINYTLRSPEGTVLDSSAGRDPLVYLHGHGNLIPGLEAELLGKPANQKLQVEVPAAQGYGERDPERVIPAKRSQFPAEAELEVGSTFQTNGPQGPMVVKVAKIEGEDVTLDANHPLAGVDLNFEVEIISIRAATSDELEHGHVHGPSCNH